MAGSSGPGNQICKADGSCQSGPAVRVLAQAVLAGSASPLALAGVLGRLGRRRALEVVAGLVVLPRVSFALAGSDHGDFVGARAAVLALQLDSLGARLVIDTPPLLGAPPAPVLRSVAPSDPVRQHRQGQALARTHQLFQRAHAGALAV